MNCDICNADLGSIPNGLFFGFVLITEKSKWYYCGKHFDEVEKGLERLHLELKKTKEVKEEFYE